MLTFAKIGIAAAGIINFVVLTAALCMLVGMGINPDTRISLLVGTVFLAAVSLCHVVFGMHKKHHQAEIRPENQR